MSFLVESLGWISGALFAFCALPQAIKTFKDSNAEGLSLLFLLMWTSGELLMMTYIVFKYGFDAPLLTSGTCDLFFLSIIWFYKLRPRRRKL